VKESPIVFEKPTFRTFVIDRDSAFYKSLRPVEFEGYEFAVPPEYALESSSNVEPVVRLLDKEGGGAISFAQDAGVFRRLSGLFHPQRLKEEQRRRFGRWVDYVPKLPAYRIEQFGTTSDFEFARRVYWATKERLRKQDALFLAIKAMIPRIHGQLPKLIEFQIGALKGFINQHEKTALFQIFQDGDYVGSMLFGFKDSGLSEQERAAIVSTLELPKTASEDSEEY